MTLKPLVTAALLGVGLAPCAQAAILTDVFSELLIFGDSLSDSGDSLRLPGTDVTQDPSNTLAATSSFGIPFPPIPYFNGRFSNRPVWSDTLIAEFEAAGKTGRNYAFGGAQAAREVSDGLIDIPDFEDQRLTFQSDPFLTPGPRPLAVVFFGGNDLLSATTDANNLFNLVEDTWDKEEGKFVLNLENDNLPGCVITHDGAVVNETIKNILEGAA